MQLQDLDGKPSLEESMAQIVVKLYSMKLATQRSNAPFQARVRGWLEPRRSVTHLDMSNRGDGKRHHMNGHGAIMS